MGSLHDYYQDRPTNSTDDHTDWENMTLAQFVSGYNISKSKPASSNAIKLQNNRGYVVRRRSECVIRYFLKYENDTEYYRALCLLFFPFRNEFKDIHSQDVEELYKKNENTIEEIRVHFEKHRDFIEKMKDFEKFAQRQAQNQIRKYNEGKEKMSDDDYLSMVNSLNSQQRKFFNDFVERITDREDESPFYVYIGGEAGTGKSFLTKLLIEATNRLPSYSGQSLDKPRSLVMAPTGVAAYIIHGSTIESALAIAPNKRKTYTPNEASRNSQLRFLYEELKALFLDEVSMVGTTKFTQMNYRLQEIMGNSKFMGGLPLICCGDFGQLPPVGEYMIWENSYLDGRVDMSPNHWKERFQIFYLTQKMRSQDEEFSVVSDKVRKGICDSEVSKYMRNHVRSCPNENDKSYYASGKLSIIVTSNAERQRINHEKLHLLLPSKKTYVIEAKDECTNVPHA